MSSQYFHRLMIGNAALLALAGCGKGNESPPPGPAQVAYVRVAEQAVTLTTELPGRTSAFETSDVRPQVNGLVLARLFQEGDIVHAGQPLYRIDASPYEAQVASARAALSRSRAAIASSAALQRRYGELVKINAISRQDFENATTTADQARADVAAQTAALRTAQIDLGRTVVKAPLSGRIGRSAFTTGALVTASQTDPLATIQRLDPIYVDIQQSSTDVLRLRQQIMNGELAVGGAATRARLRLEDGSLYPIEGTLKFTDVTVDPATGSQAIRAVFPNPHGLLLPGMFVRANVIEGTRSSAILVPQRAVSRNERGEPTVLIIGADNKVQLRRLTAPRTSGANWIVTSGLKVGDRVVVEGAQNLQPGTQVKAVPYNDRSARPADTAPTRAK